MQMLLQSLGYFFLLVAVVEGNKKCNFQDLRSEDSCGENETCLDTGICECLPSFVRMDDLCVNSDSNYANYSNLVNNQGSGSIVAGILIPLFLIVFVMCGVYITRKYHLVSWLRSRVQRRNENYDEFMIGQDDDDEPIS